MNTYETLESIRARLESIQTDLETLAQLKLLPGQAVTDALTPLFSFRDELYKLEELRRV